MRPWHLALLPAVLVANYLVMVLRHEASHGLVALAFGAQIADFHLWPPRAGNLSWITFRLPLGVSPAAVPLQAAAPYVTALVLLFASLWAVRGRLPCGFLRANVVVTGVLFPLTEIGVNVVGYWCGGNDLYYVFGSRALPLREVVTAVACGVALLSVWIVLSTILLPR